MIEHPVFCDIDILPNQRELSVRRNVPEKSSSYCMMIFSTFIVKKLVVLLAFLFIVSHMYSVVVHYICKPMA
jgi:hypothetical protein